MHLFLRTPKDPNNELHEGKAALFWGQGENDLIVDTNGDFATVEGIDNLRQSMAKILVTEKGNNIFTTIYGSDLQSLIGLNIDIDFLRGKVKMEIIDALRIYQFINKDNDNLDEQIETLNSFRIDLARKGGLDVSLTVTTRDETTTGSLIRIEG